MISNLLMCVESLIFSYYANLPFQPKLIMVTFIHGWICSAVFYLDTSRFKSEFDSKFSFSYRSSLVLVTKFY